MIRIEFNHLPGGAITGVTVNGHAGGEYGQDIVCAAVSALVQTVYLSLTELRHRTVRWEARAGHALLMLPEASWNDEQDQLLMNTLWVGLESIRSGEPKKVHIAVKEV